jgi:pimeloyl-ACP methyl ester carboxylesterase
VLMSPFLSLREVIKHSYGQMASQLVQERFKNKENMKSVHCPTFILHGVKDRVIPVWHSQILKSTLFNLFSALC